MIGARDIDLARRPGAEQPARTSAMRRAATASKAGLSGCRGTQVDCTALDNAPPHPRDCIPRVSWDRIAPTQRGHDMAVTIQVHDALVHGAHVGAFFAAAQAAFAAVAG